MRKTILLTGLVLIAAGNTGAVIDERPFRQTEPHGLVSIELENAHANVPIGGTSWAPDTTLGASGAGAVVASPNTGVVIDTNVNGSSPRLDYQVNFVQRGWHRVWVRGLGPTPSDDSVWVGIDGTPAATVNITDGAWGWSSMDEGGRPARVRIPNAGVHTVTIWMREDGTIVDKLVLVMDRFEPCGLGPDESPHDPALDAPYAQYVAGLPARCDPAAQNQPPVVNAGPDQDVSGGSQPTAVTLSGSVTDDGLPAGSLTVAWTQIGGPGVVSFAAPGSPATTATLPVVGTYVMRLTASDGALTSTDDVSVTVHTAPDLRVDAVAPPPVDPQTLAVVGPGTITYTNVGGRALAAHQILFWEDRDGDGAFDPANDNLLGTASEPAPVNAGETRTVAVPLTGTALFAGNVVHASVDSSNALAELDETNNTGSSAPACQPRGPERPFAPGVKWAWTATGSTPTSREVSMTPAVADLTGDGVPDVVFSTYVTSAINGNLRAVDGRTGGELFTITNPAHVVSAISQVAIADIDDDPDPEIIAYGNGGPTLAPGDSVIVFEHDGTFKWQVGLNQAQIAGGPAVADIDGDGTPEIAAGRILVNANGTVRWTGALGSGAGTRGPLAVIADLDMDGIAELVTGRQAYRADGTVYWQNAALPDGLDAIGNFDLDANPEVVVTSVTLLGVVEHDGATKWIVSTAALGGSGGPPTVADFDNDGVADIGRAGSTGFGVFRGTDGALLWSAPIVATLTQSAAAAFDLDGDGTREAVLTDEAGVRIFRGSDGAPLAFMPLGVCTGYTMPVIADVDADGRADIITGANTINTFSPACDLGNTQYGVYVYSDDVWRDARSIWNQHTYHITNVNDDATIPTQEAESWLLDNSYRAAAAAVCAFPIPDLTASNLRVTSPGGVTRATVRIGNGGTRTVPRTVPVAFYDGDPRAGGLLLGVAMTSTYIEGGLYEDVSFDLATPATAATIWVAADDDGAGGSRIYEQNEVNNLFDSAVRLGAMSR